MGNLQYPNIGSVVLYARPPEHLGSPDPIYVLLQHCSGTYVGDEPTTARKRGRGVFLTAGHCVFELADWIEKDWVREVYVTFNSTDFRTDLIKVHFARDSSSGVNGDWEWHTSYPGKDNIRSAVDLGVVYLDFGNEEMNPEGVKEPSPAVLATPGYLDNLKKQKKLAPNGQKFIAVGYGTQLDFPPPTIIRPDPLLPWGRLYSYSGFRALAGNFLYMSQAFPTGNSGTGFGDSGGPRFWSDDDTGKEILVAITSRGDPMCVAHDAAQRIDLPEVLDWIGCKLAPGSCPDDQ